MAEASWNELWFRLTPETRIYLAAAALSSLALLSSASWLVFRPPIARPGRPPRFLTLRALGMLASAAWTGVLLARLYSLPWQITLGIAATLGVLAGSLLGPLATLATFRPRKRLPSLSRAVGQLGQVSRAIGPRRSTIGRVHVSIVGHPVTVDAVTDHEEALGVGRRVRVTQRVGSRRVLVEALNEAPPVRAEVGFSGRAAR